MAFLSLLSEYKGRKNERDERGKIYPILDSREKVRHPFSRVSKPMNVFRIFFL